MKAIIFGASGQCGRYLTEICVREGVSTTCVSRSQENGVKGDVSDSVFVDSIIEKIKPDFIFHLAANSTTNHSALFENHETISTGSLNICEAVRKFSPKSKIFITGSGVQFKNNGLGISEQTEFEAWNAYAVSRIQSVYAARYFRSIGIQTYVGYLFHHESPFRKPNHMSRLTTDFIKNIELGGPNKLLLGDIEVKKEWAFAKDIAEGIFALMNQNVVHEATIGTGIPYSIHQWLEQCFSLVGKNWEDHIELRKDNFIPEYKVLYSDPSTIQSIGWAAKTSFEDLAKIMMQSNPN